MASEANFIDCDYTTIELRIMAMLTSKGQLRHELAKEKMFEKMYGGRATGPLTPEEAYSQRRMHRVTANPAS